MVPPAEAGRVMVVTISAAFGAGGSVVGPAVAEKLGLPFLDRALPLAVSRTLDSSLEDALAHDERPPSLLQRFFKGMTGSVGAWGLDLPAEAAITDHDAFWPLLARFSGDWPKAQAAWSWVELGPSCWPSIRPPCTCASTEAAPRLARSPRRAGRGGRSPPARRDGSGPGGLCPVLLQGRSAPQ